MHQADIAAHGMPLYSAVTRHSPMQLCTVTFLRRNNVPARTRNKPRPLPCTMAALPVGQPSYEDSKACDWNPRIGHANWLKAEKCLPPGRTKIDPQTTYDINESRSGWRLKKLRSRGLGRVARVPSLFRRIACSCFGGVWFGALSFERAFRGNRQKANLTRDRVGGEWCQSGSRICCTAD